MGELSISTAGKEDFLEIQKVVKEVWPIAYAQVISSGQIDYMLNMMYDDASLRRQMLEEKCEFILSRRGNLVTGFASYSEVVPHQFKLHKLYVLTSEQGKGTGKKLLHEVCSRSRQSGGISLELQVNKKNHPAIAFYQKNDFYIDREEVFDIGHGYVMDDYIMKKSL
ncbi:MAG: GNAT family N-acetyltransferase [Flavobacteriales bacterium]|nr:GNAT family N-acetyltransferase [Flavobacteriales bacterium]